MFTGKILCLLTFQLAFICLAQDDLSEVRIRYIDHEKNEVDLPKSHAESFRRLVQSPPTSSASRLPGPPWGRFIMKTGDKEQTYYYYGTYVILLIDDKTGSLWNDAAVGSFFVKLIAKLKSVNFKASKDLFDKL